MFRTITARYAGTCKRCRQQFEAGQQIRFGGYGRTYHLSAQCPAGASQQPTETQSAADEDESTAQPLPVLEADIIPDESTDEPGGYYKGIHWSDPAADVDSAF